MYRNSHDISVFFPYSLQRSQTYPHNRVASTMYTADDSSRMTNGILNLDVQNSQEYTSLDHPDDPKNNKNE